MYCSYYAFLPNSNTYIIVNTVIFNCAVLIILFDVTLIILQICFVCPILENRQNTPRYCIGVVNNFII